MTLSDEVAFVFCSSGEVKYISSEELRRSMFQTGGLLKFRQT